MKRLNLIDGQFESIKKKINNIYTFEDGDMEIEKTISLIIDNFNVDDERKFIVQSSISESSKSGKKYTTKWLTPCTQEILDLSVYFYFIAGKQKNVCGIAATYDSFNLFISGLRFMNYYDNKTHSLCVRASDMVKFYKDLETYDRKSKDYLYVLHHFKKLYMNRFQIRNALKNVKEMDEQEEKEREIALQNAQFKDYLQSIGMWNNSLFQ